MIRILLLTLVLSSSRSDIAPFIVGGKETSVSRWPFIAFIEVAEDGEIAAACGGSLISSQTVLTAAHCMDDVTDRKRFLYRFRYTIYMGHSAFSSSTMSRNVIDYTSHKGYHPRDGTVFGDIAVLFLRSPVSFASTVKKVLLVMQPFDIKKDKLLAVAGWGLTDPRCESNKLSPKLKSANLTALSSEKCMKMSTFPACTVICTGTSKQYAYSGDSGGPLIKRDSYYQIGLVSNRDEWTNITIFTSIPSYYNWIQDTQYTMFKKYCPKLWYKPYGVTGRLN